MMLPRNPHLAELERIIAFASVHLVQNVMGDHGLHLADKAAKGLHLVGRQESRLLELPALPHDGIEAVIQPVQAAVGVEFASMMVSSQVSSVLREFGQESVSRPSVGGFRSRVTR